MIPTNPDMDPRKARRQDRTQHIIKVMWGSFGIFVAFCFLMFLLIYNGIIGYMPPISELKNPTDNAASIIYSDDGVELGRYYQNKGNRVYVDFDEMSPYLSNALIATEDVRFLDHSGIDARGIARAIIKRGFMGQRNAGGGSTITQQLAKQLYSPTSSNVVERMIQKPIEWVIAIKLERYYTKDEIIKMYFNQFDFLNNAVGIKSAAFVYFKKDPKDLTLDESATLVGMVRNPAYYNPVRHPERTLARRNVVLDLMCKAGMISEDQLSSLQEQPLTLHFQRVDHKDGPAPYFREELRRMMSAKEPERGDYPSWNQQAYVDDSIAWATNPLYGWCSKNHKPDGSNYNIYTDGLKIYTTIDSRMQQYAEYAVKHHLGDDLQPKFRRERGGMRNPYSSDPDELPSSQKQALIRRAIQQSERYRVLKAAGYTHDEIMDNFRKKIEMRVFTYDGGTDVTMSPLDSILYTKSYLRAGMVAMDPVTGYVKAYVGGPNFHFFQYDMVSTGRRQIGSTIKPFLYTYAMEEGYTPCDRLSNTQPVIGGWAPRNSSHARVGQMVDLRWALTNSNNWISARLMERLNPATLVRSMHNFGITNKLEATIALCLGPCEVSLKEMVTAYSAFANQGMRVDPLFVSRITDNQGNVISEFTPQHTEVISETAYYKILSILLNVVDGGTANRLRRPPFNITAQMGGKTGTTNFNADGWFMGFTPQLVIGVWVGGEERYIHFNSMANGQGAAMALPIYGIFMNKVYSDKALPYSQDAKFVFPSDFNPCYKEYYGEPASGGGKSSSSGEPDQKKSQAEESIPGVFD